MLGTKYLRTTTYHPILNGLIERFHHQLKADALPLFSTAMKDDLHCTTAQLTSCASQESILRQGTSYVAQLKTTMQTLRAVPTRNPTHRSTHISDDLQPHMTFGLH